MADKALRFCKHPGCSNLTHDPFCSEHTGEVKAAYLERDRRRGSAAKRGYNWRWHKYTEWFLKQPDNQLCKLRMDDGCAIVSECVDHIDPPSGPEDPRFWDKSNHQAACIHCNSVKGHRFLRGEDVFSGE